MIDIHHILLDKKYEAIIRASKEAQLHTDPSHDFSHCLRVLRNGIKILSAEGGDIEIIAAAAFLHDMKNLPKNHPEQKCSSAKSAEAAKTILKNSGFEKNKIEIIEEAILCHSFSAGLTPTHHESKIFQDADRLDGLGAIGVARAYYTGAQFKSKLYASTDPFLKTNREPNDKDNVLDHFFQKLLKLQDMMQTPTGKKFAEKRTAFLKTFIAQLEEEVL